MKVPVKACPCGCMAVVESTEDMVTNMPDYPATYYVTCVKCEREGLTALTRNDAVRIWNAGVYEE